MRTVSLNARTAAEAQHSAEVEVALFAISHPALITPIRLSTDPTERISVEPLAYGTRSSWLGATEPYLFVRAQAQLPSDTEDAPAAATLVLDNVDRRLGDVLRSVAGRPVLHMAVVLASSPDVTEVEYRDLRIVGADGDAAQITLTISRAPIEEEAAPMHRFTEGHFPGLFA